MMRRMEGEVVKCKLEVRHEVKVAAACLVLLVEVTDQSLSWSLDVCLWLRRGFYYWPALSEFPSASKPTPLRFKESSDSRNVFFFVGSF